MTAPTLPEPRPDDEGRTATDVGKTKKGQPQEPKLSRDASMPDDYFEVRVTVTLALPYHGAHPGCRDATDRVLLALSQTSKDVLPQGTHYHGAITTTVRSAKEIRADWKRAEAKRRREA